MNVLVTGATGRIGRAVVTELLAHGHNLRALVHPDDDREAVLPGGCEVVQGALEDDVALDRAVRNVVAVVHLAAVIPDEGVSEDEIFRTNLCGTWKLLQAVSRSGTQLDRFVLASSDAVYWSGPSAAADYLPIDENHPCRPADAYGFSKLAAEHLCATFRRGDGLPFVIARFGVTARPDELIDATSLFGRRWFAAPLLAGYERIGAVELAAAIHQQLEPMDFAPALVIERDPAGRCVTQEINDSRNTARALRHMIENNAAVGEAFNVAASAPFDQENFIAHLADRLHLPVITVTRSAPLHSWYLSSAKAHARLGYEPAGSVFDMIDEACESAGRGGSNP